MPDLGRVYFHLALGQQLGRQLPKLRAKVKMVLHGRDFGPAKVQLLTDHGVRQRVAVFDVAALVLGREEVGDLAAFGADGFGADLGGGAFGDAVEDFGEGVGGVVADLRDIVSDLQGRFWKLML